MNGFWAVEMKQEFYRLVKQTARELRKNQTESEEILWGVIRNRKLLGKKFLRQYPIVFKWRGKKRFFVADFYCHEASLIVEVDGWVHEKQKDYDRERDFVSDRMGLKVIRIKNEMIEKDLNIVVESLKEFLTLSPTPSLRKRGGVRKKFLIGNSGGEL